MDFPEWELVGFKYSAWDKLRDWWDVELRNWWSSNAKVSSDL